MQRPFSCVIKRKLAPVSENKRTTFWSNHSVLCNVVVPLCCLRHTSVFKKLSEIFLLSFSNGMMEFGENVFASI